jgi:pyruvate,water dikinase
MTTPDMVPAMQRAGAIVTDEGGLTCHAAIVSREMGTPCIVGTEHATQILKDKEIITVHATNGIVYDGVIKTLEIQKQTVPSICTGEMPLTATEIKIILDLPEMAEKAVFTGADGIGLIRLEIMIAQGGIHPAEYLRKGKEKDYVELLKNGIRKMAKSFSHKPVWVRCSDMRSDEYRNLQGGDKEPKESDPMIGWHAIRRLLDEPKILEAEFKAVAELHAEGLKNIGIMLPFIIRTEEVTKAKEIMRKVGLEPCRDIDFGIMIETPASCWIIEDLCKEGISFVSFGTNDLTQLTLGLDRNNERLNKLFDEMHPAVLGEIAKVIKICKKYKVITSVCGQAGSKPEMADFLVHQGIDSISVNVDAVCDIKKLVAKTERKLLLDKKR